MRLELFLIDVRQMLVDFRLQDFGPLLFWGLWSIALFSSLRGVDRRDEIAQVTYMGAVMSLGVVLILILSRWGTKQEYGPVGKIVVFAVLLLAPSVRWLFQKKRTELDVTFQDALAGKKGNKAKK